MFSQTAEYVLRVVVYLATTGQEPCTTQSIAEATHVPLGYLAKLLQALAKSGLVKSQRGLHGGFTLGKPADQLTLCDVINAVDPIHRTDVCPLGIDHHTNGKLCGLHQRLHEAVGLMESHLQSQTVAQLVDASNNGCRPLKLGLQHG
jgi:Rrf2 family nitric oxide-sensitive transcriptional repressor